MIGLSTWHIFEHTDGRRTSLRQSHGVLAQVFDKTPIGKMVYWFLYDTHGQQMITGGIEKTLQAAQDTVDRMITSLD